MKNLVFILLLGVIPVLPSAGQDLIQNMIPLKGISEVSASGSFKVILVKGIKEGIWFEGGIEGSKDITYKFKRGRVTIRKKTRDLKEQIQTVFVYYRSIRKIQASGAVIISSEQKIEEDKLYIYASGSAFISLDLKVDYLRADLYGAAKVSVQGQCDREFITADNISIFYGMGLYSMDATCWGELDAEIRVHVYRRLKTNGHWNIHWMGNPASVDGVNSSRY